MSAALALRAVTALLAAAQSLAQSASPVDAPLGGRPAALGHAYSALAQDAYAPIWNPAGLAVVPGAQAALFQAAALPGVSRQAVALAVPLPAGQGAGLSVDAAGRTRAYGLSFGRAVGSAALGVSGRFLEDSEQQARGYAADLGYLYRFDRRLSVAAVAANLGGRSSALREDGWQPQVRFGAGYAAAHWVTYALEGVLGRESRAGVRTGFEFNFLRILSARAGLDSTVRDSPALGLTAGVGLSWAGSRLDASFVPRGAASSQQQLTLTVALGPQSRALTAPLAESRAQAEAPPPAQLSFRLEPSSAAVTGFIAEPPAADWDKPRQPQPPEKPEVEEPKHPSMIWFQ